eukprot:366030-Chlamydomonas_euryale.AAC.7
MMNACMQSCKRCIKSRDTSGTYRRYMKVFDGTSNRADFVQQLNNINEDLDKLNLLTPIMSFVAVRPGVECDVTCNAPWDGPCMCPAGDNFLRTS